VAGHVQLEDLGDFRVKGTSASMRAHRLAGTGTATTRLEVSRARSLTRFVGRGADMATLEADPGAGGPWAGRRRGGGRGHRHHDHAGPGRDGLDLAERLAAAHARHHQVE